jgi:RNA polymerase sigma factor (sigma-70 family)
VSDDLAALAERARAGDRAALEALVRAVRPMLYGLALRFLTSPADAEDATQEILIRIVTRLGQFEGRSAFRTWAYAVATRHLLGLRRRRGMTFDAFAADLAEGLAAPVTDPDAALMLEEVRIGCTLALLQCLSPAQRLAYILGEIVELDHREAAEVLRVAPAAYRKQLSRARASVTEFMLGHCGLVDRRNACRCSRRVERAAELGRIDPGRPVLARSRDVARRFPEVLAGIRRLEATQRAAALYRAQADPEPAEGFARWMRRILRRIEHGVEAGNGG